MKSKSKVPGVDHVHNKQISEAHMDGLRGVDGDDAIAQASEPKQRLHYDKLNNPRTEKGGK